MHNTSAHLTASRLLEDAIADSDQIEFGPAVNYAGYRDRDIARLISEVPVLTGQMPPIDTTIILSYLRAEPMTVLIAQPQNPASVFAEIAKSRADAVLILLAIDPASDPVVEPQAKALLQLSQTASAAGLFAFSVLIDGFQSRHKWIKAQNVDAKPWSALPTKSTKNWIGSPRTQAAIRAGTISVPGSARQLGSWAPGPDKEIYPELEPIAPASGEPYRQFTTALVALVTDGLQALHESLHPILASTCSQQPAEVINAYGDNHQTCALDMAALASHSRGKTRSRLLSIAALAQLLAKQPKRAQVILSAIDDIATSGGRTPLSEVVRLRLADELDEERFDQAMRLIGIARS